MAEKYDSYTDSFVEFPDKCKESYVSNYGSCDKCEPIRIHTEEKCNDYCCSPDWEDEYNRSQEENAKLKEEIKDLRLAIKILANMVK